MAKDTDPILHALRRLDSGLVLEGGRVGLLRRWLQDHGSRLEDLSSRIQASLARIETLVGKIDV